MPTFEVAGQDYNRKEALELRDVLIELRDHALKGGQMDWAVHLSHAVGLWACMINHIWPEE